MTVSPEPAERPRTPFPRMRVPSAAAVVAGAAVAAVLVILYSISGALPVFIIGLIVAYILDPLVTWLAAHRVPRGIAALLSMGLVGAILAVLGGVFLETVLVQAAAFIAGLPKAFAEISGWILTLGLPAKIEQDLVNFLASLEANVKSFDVTLLLAPLVDGMVAILGSFFTLLTLPFFLFFVLAGRPALGKQLSEVLPDPWRDDVLTVLGITLNSFGTYVRAEAIVAGVLGVITFVGIMLLSVFVDPAFAGFALLLAIIAAFSEFIPNFGPWIAAIPAVLIALTISPQAVLATAVLYLVLMFLEGQVLVPKIEGGAFSFHPALVLFLVVAGVALMGILGAILALPVTAAVWRSTRFAFRRASGLPLEEALDWSGDDHKDELLPSQTTTAAEVAAETTA